MPENRSNQDLLIAWRNGSQAAAEVLVRRYMLRLTAMARTHLSRRLSRRVEADDVVMSAWRSFFVAVDQRRVDVPPHDDLWPLLVTITRRKLSRQVARHSADRRSIDIEQTDSALDWPAAVAHDPTPHEAAAVADQVEALMSQLCAADREILSRRLQGETQTEIAERLKCSERTVRRSLERIREKFLKLNASDTSQSNVEAEAVSATTPDTPFVEPPSESRPTIHVSEILLQQLVGSGAFGKVYRSRRHTTASQVAVKFLRRSFWRDQRAIRQLIHEFELMKELDHPGIARSFGWGQTTQGATFVVLEWIGGGSLLESAVAEPHDHHDALRCGVEIAEAAVAAHQAGVIHGDLTPGNVLQASRGCVLTDFGFGQFSGSVRAGRLGGTPGFLAPEQLSDAFGGIRPQTDVFGLGGILFFLLTGRPPITGNDPPEIIANTLLAAPVPPVNILNPSVPARLTQLIEQCLQKDPTARPTTMEEVLEKLRRLRP